MEDRPGALRTRGTCSFKARVKIQKAENRARELMQMSEAVQVESWQGNAPSEKGHPIVG